MNVCNSVSFLYLTVVLTQFFFYYCFLRLKAVAKSESMNEGIGKSKTGQTCVLLAPSALPVYSYCQIRIWFLGLWLPSVEFPAVNLCSLSESLNFWHLQQSLVRSFKLNCTPYEKIAPFIYSVSLPVKEIRSSSKSRSQVQNNCFLSWLLTVLQISVLCISAV